MRKFDRTNMKYNNPAGDLLTELEAADLTSNKVDSLASSGVVVLCQDLVQVKMRNFSPF